MMNLYVHKLPTGLLFLSSEHGIQRQDATHERIIIVSYLTSGLRGLDSFFLKEKCAALMTNILALPCTVCEMGGRAVNARIGGIARCA